ncbi:MAG: hypothetical protein K0R38_6110 [Polyangiaceae bacterium]|nr:hypothetical protein [Polyangiaceae bacterium]
MNEHSRLLESTDDPLERALLGAVLAESPSEASLRDAALALGLTATAATALVTTLPAVATSLGASPAAAAPLVVSGVAPGVAATAGAASLLTLGKALVGGAIVSFLALTTVDRTLSAEGSAPSVAVVTSSRTQPGLSAPQAATPVSAVEVVAVTPPPEPAVVEPSSRRSLSPAPRPATVVVPQEAPSAPAILDAPAPEAPKGVTPNAASLAAETRLLASARTALASGDTGTAAQLLQQYQAGEPSGILAREAALLRVRLLLATGQRAAASEQARHIISLYPRDAHADSLRRLAAER